MTKQDKKGDKAPKKSKLFSELYQTLNVKQRQQFRYFLEGELTNHRDNFARYCKDLYVKLEEIEYQPFVPADLIPKQLASIKNKIILALTEILVNFIAYLGLKGDEPLRDRLLLGEITQNPNFLHFYKKAEKKLDEKGKAGYYYLTKFDLYQEYQSHLSSRNLGNPQEVFRELNHSQILAFAHRWYRMAICRQDYSRIYQDDDPWVSKIEEKNVRLAIHLILNPDEDQKDNTREALSDSVLNEIQTIDIYRKILSLFRKPDIPESIKLGAQILCLLECPEKQILFSQSEFLEVFNWTTNILIRSINAKSETDCTEMLFSLYQAALQNSTLVKHPLLPAMYFRNAVKSGLKIKPTPEVREFMDKNQSALNNCLPEKREEIMRACELSCCFYEGKYEEVLNQADGLLELSRKIPNNSLKNFMKIFLRRISIKAYYELLQQEEETNQKYDQIELEKMIENLDASIRRTKHLKGYHKDSFWEWVKLFKRLYKFGSGMEYDRLMRLKKDILETIPVDDKGWLLEKVEARLQSELPLEK